MSPGLPRSGEWERPPSSSSGPRGRSTVLGYPRIGADRGLKRAVEAYWAGTISPAELESTAAGLRAEVWQQLRNARLDAIPSNTFSYCDHVLDTAVAVGAIPARFARLGPSTLDTYFAMARGVDAEPALELTKWFNTDHHYLVPEIDSGTAFNPDPTKPLSEYGEARVGHRDATGAGRTGDVPAPGQRRGPVRPARRGGPAPADLRGHVLR